MAKKLRLPNTIHVSPIGRRTLAFILDLVIILTGIFAVYYAFGRPVILANNGYQETVAEPASCASQRRLIAFVVACWTYGVTRKTLPPWRACAAAGAETTVAATSTPRIVA